MSFFTLVQFNTGLPLFSWSDLFQLFFLSKLCHRKLDKKFSQFLFVVQLVCITDNTKNLTLLNFRLPKKDGKLTPTLDLIPPWCSLPSICQVGSWDDDLRKMNCWWESISLRVTSSVYPFNFDLNELTNQYNLKFF